MRINKILTYGFIAAFGLSAFTESSVSTETESANAKTTEGEGKKLKLFQLYFHLMIGQKKL